MKTAQAIPRVVGSVFLFLPLVFLLSAARNAWPLGDESIVHASYAPGDFALVHEQAANILMDENDWPGVARAVDDLVTDVNLVTGRLPAISTVPASSAKNAVIIGTLGKSEIIDQLIRAKKIEVSSIAGKWESFFLQVVSHPLPGIASAVVIRGSDKRGTIYYHFDYHGGPRSYQWINTSPIPKVWEQLSLAQEYGASQVWIVNVGHLKGYEFPLEFFLHLVWDTDRWTGENLDEYTRLWAEREFGAGPSLEIAQLIAAYTNFNGRCKPEVLDANTYSLVNYNEFETVVTEYAAIAARTQTVYDQLPAERRDAFYELVQFPVKACAQLNALYLAAARNALFAKQGRASANDYAAQTRALFAMQTNLMDHFNHSFGGGKWNHFMDQAYIGYTNWNDPPCNRMDAIKLTMLQAPDAAEMGVAVEGSTAAWPDAADPAVLPPFDNFNRQRRFVDVFIRGTQKFQFTAQADSRWILVGEIQGQIEKERRIWIGVDWSQAPVNQSTGAVKFVGNGREVTVRVIAFRPAGIAAASLSGFVEADGFVSIQAEHYTARIQVGDATWTKIPNYGLSLSGMRASGPTDAMVTPGKDSSRPEYKMLLFDTGRMEVKAIVGSTLNFLPGRGIRHAVSFDDEPPHLVTVVPADFIVRNGNEDWEESVKHNCHRVSSTHFIDRQGYHILKIWMVDPSQVLEKIVVNAGGLRPGYLGPPESYHHLAPGGPMTL